MMVTWETTACQEKAEGLAKAMNCRLAKTAGYDFSGPYTLFVAEERLEVLYKEGSRLSRLSVEFVKGPLGYRRQKGGGKNQALARAVGLKSHKGPLTVLDVTAGLGRDAFILASLGCEVQMVERSPLMALLLQDGLERGLAHKEVAPILAKIKLIQAEATEVLTDLTPDQYPDVIYLDPMFPTENKNALNKIEMRIIREVVGDDLDAAALLVLSLKKAKKRVVVKRSSSAILLTVLKPSFTLEGKSNRYDVYVQSH